MAVVAMWQCDRDGSMFASKKEAEAYDRMLELAEGFTALIEAHATGVSAEDADALGQLLARHRDAVISACKGKPEVLADLAAAAKPAEQPGGRGGRKKDTVVTPLVSKG